MGAVYQRFRDKQALPLEFVDAGDEFLSRLEGVTDPVTISPFLQDLQERFDHQYQVTFKPLSVKGIQPVKLKLEFSGLKVYGPEHVYVR